MPTFTLSHLAIILGLGFGLPQIFGILNPDHFKKSVRSFSRSLICGYILMTLGTSWFLWNLYIEAISDFESYKRMMYVGFAGIGVLTCLYVSDFLAVRGSAILFLLLAKSMVDASRWVESSWRWVVVLWAYLLIIAGVWFTVSPWRMRDFLHWATETEYRIRIRSSVRLGFGLLLVILGFTVF